MAPSRRSGAVLLLCGLLGAAAAFTLMVEKVRLLEDPSYVPSCSYGSVLNCGTVMMRAQAEVLGFPNPLIGLATFPVLAATGALLLAGVRLPRWYGLALQAGVVLGLVFVIWLIAQSLYEIGALCPYCMVVWVVTIAAFWVVTLQVADARLRWWIPTLVSYAVVGALVLQRFHHLI